MTSPSCTARTWRAENEPPSRSRSTWRITGRSTCPGRRKYPCSEWGRRSAGTVAPAARSACAATWPPYSDIRAPAPSSFSPRNRSRSRTSRSSSAARPRPGALCGFGSTAGTYPFRRARTQPSTGAVLPTTRVRPDRKARVLPTTSGPASGSCPCRARCPKRTIRKPPVSAGPGGSAKTAAGPGRVDTERPRGRGGVTKSESSGSRSGRLPLPGEERRSEDRR